MTPDQYMGLLLERQQAHLAEHGGFPPLLEWFVRDGDERLVDLPTAEPEPKRETRPRTYLPASHWREELARIDAELAALDGVSRHGTDDPAAYGGIGIRQTPRQARKYGERLDRTAERYGRLSRERARVAGKVRRAEGRESAA